MNAAIPDSHRDFVLARIANGGYTSVDDYVDSLIRADRERLAQDRLEEELERGLAGERVRVTPEDFERLRERIRQRHAGSAAAERG